MTPQPFPVMVNRSHVSLAVAHLLMSIDPGLRVETARAYADFLITFVTDTDAVRIATEHAAEELCVACDRESLRLIDPALRDGYRFRAALVVSSFLTRLAHHSIHIDPPYPLEPSPKAWPR